MMEFENFIQTLREKFPDLKCEIDRAETESGSSWVDIISDETRLTIEYRPHMGFGLYKETSSNFGEGPSEVFRNRDFAIKRIEAIIKNHKFEVRLDELQEMFGQTGDLPENNNLSDLTVQELVSFIESKGGSLEINAHFKECDVPISLGTITR